MFKKIAATAVLAACAVSGAQAQTITAGLFTGTTQFTAVNDPVGLCAADNLVSAGEVQTSEGAFGLGRSPVVVTATPDPTGTTSGGATTYAGVAQQTCTYAKLPTALDPSGTTVISGVTNCTSTNTALPPVRIVTGTAVDGITGVATVNTVKINTFKITTLGAALEAYVVVPPATTPAWTPLCFINTDGLFIRTGK